MQYPVWKNFAVAIQRLDEALARPKDDFLRDSAIKCFELCFDLARKSIKIHAQKEGNECYSPRACFKTALQLNLIENDQHWLEMIVNRNLAAHLYKESMADEIYKKPKD